MTALEFEEKWHQKLVRPKSYYKIPDKEYIVTAALFDEETTFAIMATDYTLENKQYITFKLSEEEVDKLDERFEILGDYNNIDSEIVFEIAGSWMHEGKECWVVNSKNYTNGVETKNNKLPIPLLNPEDVGSWLYDICWTSTTGQKFRKAFATGKKDGSSMDQVRESYKKVRSWILTGTYHFVDIDQLLK